MTNGKTVYKIIFAFSCIIFVICAALLIKMYLPETSDNTQYKNESTTSTTTATEYVLPENPIDFDKLKAENKDVYAWITIPDTNIDYPIVQSSGDKDDLFYLDHNINGDYEFAGMIFSERKNSRNFSDPVTVLYGHNMKNGSMFHDLHKFEETSFFEQNDTIYIYCPGRIYTYTIVSAYVYDDRHILNTYNFSEKENFKEYIDSITNPHSYVSNVRKDVEVSVDDHILTLSTCTSNDSQRYLVQGVLTDETITE